MDLSKLIADGRKCADDFQKGDWQSGIQDSLNLLQEIYSEYRNVFPNVPAKVDPNAPPALAAHFAPAGATPHNLQSLGTQLKGVCDTHEKKSANLGADAAGNHPVIQAFIKNLLPLLIEALKFFPVGA